MSMGPEFDAVQPSPDEAQSNAAASVDVLIAGAGPCGLACAIAAQNAGLSAVVIDRGPIVSGIASYPTYMSFFSTAEKLSIGGLPFVVAAEKPTRRDALAYYRNVASHYQLDVRQFETVQTLTPIATTAAATSEASARAARWAVQTRRRSGVSCVYHAHAVVVATGYFGRPNRLGVPGESLPHVQHGYTEGHSAWHEPVVIIGGGNSAVDAALDMHRSGARVTIVHFLPGLDVKIKPWVRPEINARIADDSIAACFESRVIAIEAEHVVIAGPSGERRIPATQVYAMTGYLPETGLLEQAQVPIDATTGIPQHDPATMATPLPGLYLAGVIASGFDANKIFIENGRDHGDRIAAHVISH
jgi:thioredoxin reductase (NADPH)